MSALAAELTGLTEERIVVDRTDLAGTFDVNLRWSPDQTEGASLFTVIQEQLGLKLEPRTERLDAVVIDSIQRPEPN